MQASATDSPARVAKQALSPGPHLPTGIPPTPAWRLDDCNGQLRAGQATPGPAGREQMGCSLAAPQFPGAVGRLAVPGRPFMASCSATATLRIQAKTSVNGHVPPLPWAHLRNSLPEDVGKATLLALQVPSSSEGDRISLL